MWLQHAAGFILFEKVRASGLATLEPDAPEDIRKAVGVAIDATIYALMMQIDGVTGGLRSDERELNLTFGVELVEHDSVVAKFDLREGDGMCMGFHYWVEGDFGDSAVVEK